MIGGEYLYKKYDYKDMRIPVEQFTAEEGYYLKFLSDRRKTFFLSLGLSALAGYETSNRNETLLPDGKGKLEMDNGTVFLPNDLYPLEKEMFRLYYTSASTDQQTIDIYVIDSFGQVQQLSFSFNNDNDKDE